MSNLEHAADGTVVSTWDGLVWWLCSSKDVLGVTRRRVVPATETLDDPTLPLGDFVERYPDARIDSGSRNLSAYRTEIREEHDRRIEEAARMAGQRMTAAEIAKDLGVHPRTAQRYLAEGKQRKCDNDG